MHMSWNMVRSNQQLRKSREDLSGSLGNKLWCPCWKWKKTSHVVWSFLETASEIFWGHIQPMNIVMPVCDASPANLRALFWVNNILLGAAKAWNMSLITSLRRLCCRQMEFLCLKEDTELFRCPLIPSSVLRAAESKQRRDGFILRMSLMYKHSGKVDKSRRTFFRYFKFYTRRKRRSGRVFFKNYF